jgi:outer membrane cobalamin receptor
MSIVRQTLTLPLILTLPLNASVADETQGVTALDDISVTATRVEKRLETVPAAVGIV